MSQRKAPNLKWIGGDSRSSVWFGLGTLLMPAEYERVEAIRKSRRARAQKGTEESAAATAPVDNAENASADVQEAQNPEARTQEEDAPLVDGNETPQGEATPDQPAENAPEEVAAETQEAGEPAEKPESSSENNNRPETSQVVGDSATNAPPPATAAATVPDEPQPCPTGNTGGPAQTLSLSAETTPNRFSRGTTVVETPTPQPWSQGYSHPFEQDPPSRSLPPVFQAELHSPGPHSTLPAQPMVEVYRQRRPSSPEQYRSTQPLIDQLFPSQPAHTPASDTTQPLPSSPLPSNYPTPTPPPNHHPSTNPWQYQQYYHHPYPYFNPTVPTHHYLLSNHPHSSATTYWTTPRQHPTPSHQQYPLHQLPAEAQLAEFGYANYHYAAGTSFPASWVQDCHQTAYLLRQCTDSVSRFSNSSSKPRHRPCCQVPQVPHLGQPALSLASAIQTKSSEAKNGLEVRLTHLPDQKRKDFDDNQRLMGDFLERFPSKG
jgi:hypothetical protein